MKSSNQQPMAEITSPLAKFLHYMTDSTWSRRRGARDVMDFMLGTPQEMPIPEVTAALQYWSDPLTKDWYGYKTSEEHAQEISARSLRERTGVPFAPEDIAMTNGAFGALSVGLKLVARPGDEVIINLPAWSFYEPIIRDAGLTPVKVPVRSDTLDIDVPGIAAALTPRTSAIILNAPNTPTGRIYPRNTLQTLANVLEEASRCNNHRIHILSDEVFARIVFDGARSISPAEVYDHTLVVYSWSKQLLTPGQRIGFLALHPRMPDRERLRKTVLMTQIAGGFVFPSALMQHALADIDPLTIDIEHLERKRDRMAGALRDIGYEVQTPEGAYYLMPQSPIPDDQHFAELLADRDVFVLPGELFEYPGYFRISLTASDDMIERSLTHFASLYQRCKPSDALIAD